MTGESAARRAHRARGAVLRVLPPLLLIALMSVALTSVPPAAAHAALLESSPRHGDQLREVPPSLRLTFSADLTPRFMQVALTVDDAAPIPLESHVDGPLLTADVPPGVADGLPETAVTSWRVDYRVVSADGHPVTGAVEFTVSGGETASTGAPEGETAPAPTVGAVAPTPAEPRPSRGGPGAGWRWVVAAGALAAVLASGAVALRRERRRRHDAGG